MQRIAGLTVFKAASNGRRGTAARTVAAMYIALSAISDCAGFCRRDYRLWNSFYNLSEYRDRSRSLAHA